MPTVLSQYVIVYLCLTFSKLLSITDFFFNDLIYQLFSPLSPGDEDSLRQLWSMHAFSLPVIWIALLNKEIMS